MASADCKLIEKAIFGGKCLKINKVDNTIEIQIKTMINHLVLEDKITSYTSCNGKKIPFHSSWTKMYKTLIKINQLRLKHWYFKSIS